MNFLNPNHELTTETGELLGTIAGLENTLKKNMGSASPAEMPVVSTMALLSSLLKRISYLETGTAGVNGAPRTTSKDMRGLLRKTKDLIHMRSYNLFAGKVGDDSSPEEQQYTGAYIDLTREVESHFHFLGGDGFGIDLSDLEGGCSDFEYLMFLSTLIKFRIYEIEATEDE